MMRDLFEISGDNRHLSDAEVIYQITNSAKTSKEVETLIRSNEKVTIEDICNTLTPAKKELALAVVELYKRLQSRNYYAVTNSRDAYNILKRYLLNLPNEEFWVLYLNHANKVIRKKRISVGGIKETSVDISVIFKEAVICGATGMILAHNHPSGTLTPSLPDRKLTERIVKASELIGIKVFDHIIFTDDNYFSFADDGCL